MKKIFVEADSIVAAKMSGIGHATLEILRAFDTAVDRGADIVVVALIPRGTRNATDQYGFRNIRIKTMPVGQKYLNYALTRTGLPIPMDLWFGRGVYIFPNYKNWYLSSSQSLTFIHDVAFKIFPESTQPKNLLYLEANFNRWLERSTKILSISKASADDFKRYFPEFKDKVEVVHLGVDPVFYSRQTTSTITRALNRYGLPNDYFLYVGNIEPRKNIERLLDAFVSYRDLNNGEAALVLIGGDGWKNEATKARIAHLQDSDYPIFWPQNYVPDEDLPALYSGSRALLHFALHEGFGLPPLQAQACGTMVISSELGVFKETLDQKMVHYVDLSNLEQVTEVMLETESHKSHSTTVALTWDKTVSQILQIIDKIS